MQLTYLNKLFNDQKRIILLLILFGLLFEFLFSWVFFKSEISKFVETILKLFPPTITSFLGVEPGSGYFNFQMLAFGYSHPLILICLSILPISLPAKYISREIEIKTFDLLLTRPFHRLVIPSHVFLFITITLFFQVISIFIGTLIAYFCFQLNIDLKNYANAAVTAYFFYLSMGTISLAISSYQNEYGKALAKTITLFVFLYFFDTIIRLHKSLEFLISYSYFQLYQPGKIVMGEVSSTKCVFISLVIILLFFSISLIQFNRRDI
jgi:ABC-type transport system involved in multi-copper enzyme maturation permease subunit